MVLCEKDEDWSLKSDTSDVACFCRGVAVKSVSRSVKAADFVIMRR